MAGWKEWLSGEVVEHTDFQSFVQDQVVQVFPGTAARGSVLGENLSAGMVTYLEDSTEVQYWNGSEWKTLDTGTDPAIFTAGVEGQLLSSLGTAGVAWLNQGSVVAGSASFSGIASYATSSGTAVYATNAGTAVFATTAGTSTFATNAGTATFATTSGTADYATTSGTAVFANSSGTASALSGTISATQVSGTAVTLADTGTVTNAMLAGSIENGKLVNSVITLNGTAVPLGGSATISGGTAGGFTNPMTTLGDLIVGGAAGAAERLGIGSAGQVLSSNGTVASWSTPTGGALPTQTGNAGELLVTDGTAASWSNTVTANAASAPAIIARGTTSQTAAVQQWQNSAGSVVASINDSGSLNLSGALIVANITLLSGLLTARPNEASALTNTASSVGYIGLPQFIRSSGGTLFLDDKGWAGRHIYVTTTPATITIDANSSTPFEIGTTIVIINANVTSQIAITTDTLLLAGAGTTGSRTLAAHGMATLVKITSTSWIISGNGLS